jgi:hypothetical protein
VTPIYTITLFEHWKRENYAEIYDTMHQFGIPDWSPNTIPGSNFSAFAGGIYFGTLPKECRLAFYERRRRKHAARIDR